MRAHLRLTLDYSQPIEVDEFVGLFSAVESEYRRYLEEAYPENQVDGRIYVKTVRSGSIEADLIGGLVSAAALAAPHVGQILVYEDFIRRWGARLEDLIKFSVAQSLPDNPRQLESFHNAVVAIARDPSGSVNIEAAVFEDGKRQVRSAFKFGSSEAKTVQENIEHRKKALRSPASRLFERVLMVFTRTDVHDAKVNKRSSERAIVEAISPDEKSLVYASELVENECRRYIRDADDNVYKKGFIVDVSQQFAGARHVAYSVMKLHSVIDID